MSRNNRKTLLDLTKASSNLEGFDRSREANEARETVQARLTASLETGHHNKLPRLSPQQNKSHRRSRDLTPSSSQESLHMAGGGPGGSTREQSGGSISDLHEYERRKSSVDITSRPITSTIIEEPHDISPDGTDNTSYSERANGIADITSEESGIDKESSPGVSFDNGSPLEEKSFGRSDTTSDSHGEKTGSRQGREKSFERSLDNIMEKCSEKSLDLNLSVESWNGSVSESSTRSPDNSTTSGVAKYSKAEKKKRSAWYTMLAPSYKSKTDDFRKIFKDIPHDERLIVDYSCALQKDILVQGRMYVTQNWVCFYANIFRWETVLTIQCKEITAITKEKTARLIPNAIAITSEREKHFLTSFGARDKTFMMLFRIWQNALLDQPMNPKELWQWIHYSYGEELGLTSSDDDYVPPPGMDDLRERLCKDDVVPPKGLSDSSDVHLQGDMRHLLSTDETDILVADEVFCQSPGQKESSMGICDNDVPTDFGDTTDTEGFAGEITCSGHEHLEKCYLDEVFGLSVDQVFEFIFTDSAFFRQFVTTRKTFNLDLPDWNDAETDGSRTRVIHYTLTLNQSIGPKTSPSEEKQTCYKDSKPGMMYLVDTDCANGGIPYADAFYVTNRYCLTRVSKSRCRVHVTSEVRYKKSVIGIVRGMIERSAVGGLTDYFRTLSAHLRREAERLETILNSQKPQKKKVRRRRKIAGSTSEVSAPLRLPERQISAPPSPLKITGVQDGKMSAINVESLVKLILVIMSVLVVLNAILFFKLWSLEDTTRQKYWIQSPRDIDDIDEYPRSQEQWAVLLREQKMLYKQEMSKWKQVLSASIQLMDQMKQTLEQLHNGLDGQQRGKNVPS